MASEEMEKKLQFMKQTFQTQSHKDSSKTSQNTKIKHSIHKIREPTSNEIIYELDIIKKKPTLKLRLKTI